MAGGAALIAPDDSLVLAPSVVILPVDGLPGDVRERLEPHGAYALTSRHGRAASSVIDEALAALLEEFREPSTVVEAIVRYSARLELDPHAALSDSYAALRGCVDQGFLVAAGSEAARPLRLRFEPGERVGPGTVVRCVHALQDAEVHQLALDGGGFGALKVAPPDALRHEAAVLRRLGGGCAPRLLAEGDGWLVEEWCEGAPADRAAAALRDPGRLRLACRIAQAYARLQEAGVVHGDVHPGNVRVAPSGEVRLIDFALSPGEGVPRGGVPAFYEPEFALARLEGRPPPPATAASDAYALGALLYELLAGAPYLELSLDADELLRQVAHDEPLPFARRGRDPWPEVERPLRAALAKDPRARPRDLARRLAAVRVDAPVASGPEAVRAAVLAKLRPGGEWFEGGVPGDGPSGSVVYGAAGIAAALAHIAVLEGDPALLALADEWSVRSHEGSFTSDALEITDASVGLTSPFHRRAGAHAVEALIAHARGDDTARLRALTAFIETSRGPAAALDLTLGSAGTLLAAALLAEAFGEAPERLAAFARETRATLWRELELRPPRYLGIAHGWAGVLLATLRWSQVSGDAPPPALAPRLDELAGLGEPEGLGMHWPLQRGGGGSMAGWCHGSAGYVHLWTTAHAVVGEDRWATLAERAAWDAYTRVNTVGQLCCGHCGQAYGLLEMHRASGERRWLVAAAELAGQAAARHESGVRLPASLHKGDVGIAALAADLRDPGAAAMPFFARAD